MDWFRRVARCRASKSEQSRFSQREHWPITAGQRNVSSHVAVFTRVRQLRTLQTADLVLGQDRRTVSTSHDRFVGAAAATPAALGILALIGWITGTHVLVELLPGGRTMQPLTAVGTIAGGCALWASSMGRQAVANALATLTAIIGLQSLLQTATGISLGTDYLLFKQAVLTQSTALGPPGRPSILSSICFVMFGMSMLPIGVRRRAGRSLGVIVSSLGLAIAFLSLLGFLLLAGDPVHRVDASLIMPLHTAVGFTALFGGMLLLQPEENWVGVILSEGWQGRVARYFLPMAAIPVLLGWAAEWGHGRGWYGSDVRMLLIVLGGVLVLVVGVILAAKLLGQERQEREGMAKALDLSPNVLCDNQGKIIYWSKGAEHLYGWSGEEALGQDCTSLLGLRRRNSGEGLQGSRQWREQQSHRTKSGNSLFVVLRSVHYQPSEQSRPFELFFVTDISEERRAQDALVEQEERLNELQSELLEVSRLSSMGEMAAALAHELNQPLTAAVNYLGAVEVGLARAAAEPAQTSFDPIADAVRRARDESLRAGEIVRRLRDFIARGDVDMKREPLAEIINNALALAFTGAAQKVVDVRCDLSDDARHVLADRVQIQQVIVNLARNAREAMAEARADPQIFEIRSATAPGGMVEISVSDSGPGLPEEIFNSLFVPFTSSKRTGLGVGLSICKRIVESHGGRIWATRREGEGASFHFTLPGLPAAEDVP